MSLIRSIFLSFLFMMAMTLAAAPQIAPAEAEATSAFTPGVESSIQPPEASSSASSDEMPSDSFLPSAHPLLSGHAELDVPAGQPLPGLGLTLLIGATFCYSMWKRRKQEAQSGRASIAVDSELSAGNQWMRIFHNSTHPLYSVFLHRSIILRL